jgi:hypothetical protein
VPDYERVDPQLRRQVTMRLNGRTVGVGPHEWLEETLARCEEGWDPGKGRQRRHSRDAHEPDFVALHVTARVGLDVGRWVSVRRVAASATTRAVNVNHDT